MPGFKTTPDKPQPPLVEFKTEDRTKFVVFLARFAGHETWVPYQAIEKATGKAYRNCLIGTSIEEAFFLNSKGSIATVVERPNEPVQFTPNWI